MNKLDELLPCPFCGAGLAKPMTATKGGFSGVELSVTATGCPYVWCGTCGGEGPAEETEAQAIAAWNTRASDTLARQSAKMEELVLRAVEAALRRISDMCPPPLMYMSVAHTMKAEADDALAAHFKNKDADDG